MFCHLYGSRTCTMFQAKWVPVAHHILITSDSLKWEHVLSFNSKDEIEKYQKTLANRKPTFYRSGFVMDALCATSLFPASNWNWDKNCPLVHILFWYVGEQFHSSSLCDLRLVSRVNVSENFQRWCPDIFRKRQGINLSTWRLVCRRIFLLYEDLGQKYGAYATKNCPWSYSITGIFLPS